MAAIKISSKVDEAVWRELRSIAEESHQSIGGLLTEATNVADLFLPGGHADQRDLDVERLVEVGEHLGLSQRYSQRRIAENDHGQEHDTRERSHQ